MTNHIEEMMQMAGVKVLTYQDYELNEVEYLPDFTPEKRFKIIELITDDNDIGFLMLKRVLSKYYLLTHKGCIGKHADFTQALAQLTTELMKAGELDKEKVKEILEG